MCPWKNADSKQKRKKRDMISTPQLWSRRPETLHLGAYGVALFNCRNIIKCKVIKITICKKPVLSMKSLDKKTIARLYSALLGNEENVEDTGENTDNASYRTGIFIEGYLIRI
ncbi:hypothetical protein J6590_055554 [Homalodisca vitripennis]|nr:hypothetical protein J6590_055554 [Homalodisca vitripennis]